MGASAKLTITVLTDESTTLNRIAEITTPIKKGKPKATLIPVASLLYPSNQEGFNSFMTRPTQPVRQPTTKQKRDRTLEIRSSLMMTVHPFCWNKVMTFFPASR